MGISNHFNDETELQGMTAESLSLARAQKINHNTVVTFFYRAGESTYRI
jgi:hypothetical protein